MKRVVHQMLVMMHISFNSLVGWLVCSLKEIAFDFSVGRYNDIFISLV